MLYRALLFLLICCSVVTEARDIRVGIQLNQKEVDVSSRSLMTFYRGNRKILSVNPGNTVKVWIGKDHDDSPADDAQSGWYIQVGAFKKKSSVENCTAMLADVTDLEPVTHYSKAKKLYLVQLGPFYSLSEASSVKDLLKMGGFSDVYTTSQTGTSSSRTALFLITANYDKKFLTGSNVTINSESPVTIDGKSYRGTITFRIYGNVFNVVNTLDMQTYLKGVVPAEMSPALYPSLDAMKAQAIAARTYVYYNLNQFKDMGFDICATQSCQVYKGVSVEMDLSNQAVDETEGEVITYEGKPINALFTAYCGGHTEDVEHVFSGRAVPYLKGVECRSEGGDWVRRDFKARYIGSFLNSSYTENPTMAATWLLSEKLLMPDELRILDKQALPEQAFNIIYRVLSFLGFPPEESKNQLKSLSDAGKLIAGTLFPGNKMNLIYESGLVKQYLPEIPGTLGDYASIGYEMINAFQNIENYGLTFKMLDEKRLEGLTEPDLIYIQTGTEYVPVGSCSMRLGDRLRVIEKDGNTSCMILLTRESQENVNDSFLSGYTWHKFISAEDLKKGVEKYGRFGQVKNLEIVTKTDTGRIAEIRVIGTRKSGTLKGLQVRWALGVKENKFEMNIARDEKGWVNGLVVFGSAWGHGVGLCQIGCFGLASSGMNYKDILKHYYTGVEIERIEF